MLNLTCPSRGLAATFLLVAVASPGLGQVGHPPSQSPYRDLPYPHSFELQVGYFGGDGSQFKLGPHDGTSYGLRYNHRISNPLEFGFSVTYATLKRAVVYPLDSLAHRFHGIEPTSVTMVTGTIQGNLTGRKTWHNFAPYISGSIGFAFGGAVSADTSLYDFGTKFTLAPALGVRYYLTRKLFARLETNWNFWRLSYPATFGLDPPGQPGTPPGSNALIQDGHFTDWTSSFRLIFGLGFNAPF